LRVCKIILVEPQSNLLCPGGSNLDVQVFKLVAEFLDAVATPELALGVIPLETLQFALLFIFSTII
jgi:hypothetical protein